MAETIGALAIGAIGAAFGIADLAAFTVAGIGVTTLAGEVIVGGAAIGLSALLKPNVPSQGQSPSTVPPPEAGSVPIKQAISPRIVGLGGPQRLAGAYVLYEANAGISYDICAFHHGLVGSIVGFYLDDDVVTFNAGTGIVDVQGDGRYANNCITILQRLGHVPATAYTEITGPLSAIWTSAHRGDGLASMGLICNQAATPSAHANQYPRGKPTPSVVANCTPIYDPRDGTQSLADPTTWQVSNNPVLQTIFFLTDADRGMGLDWSTLIAPSLAPLMHEADLCDALVLRNDAGSEPRYASIGSYPLDSDPADVLAPILDSGDIWLSQNGDGSLALTVGQYRAPSVTILSKHIRAVSLQYDVGNEAVVNEFSISYTEPALDFKTEPGQPWRDEADISSRGKTLSQQLALPWVYSHPQARRLAKRKMARARAPLRGTITTTLYGLRALGERWVGVNAPDIPDLANLTIEITNASIDLLNAQMTFTFVSVDPAAIDVWDPATEEGSAPVVASKLVTLPPPVPLNLQIRFSGVAQNPAFIVKCDDPGRSDLSFQTEWRVNGSGGSFTLDPKQAPVTNPPGGFGNVAPQVYGGYGMPTTGFVTYEVKMRAFAPTGAGSAFSASQTFVYP